MLINKILEKKDSGNEKIKTTNSSIIKEWTYNNNSPFVAIGITEIIAAIGF